MAPVALLGGLSLLLGLLAALRRRARAQLMPSVVQPHLLMPCAPAQLWNATR